MLLCSACLRVISGFLIALGLSSSRGELSQDTAPLSFAFYSSPGRFGETNCSPYAFERVGRADYVQGCEK